MRFHWYQKPRKHRESLVRCITPVIATSIPTTVLLILLRLSSLSSSPGLAPADQIFDGHGPNLFCQIMAMIRFKKHCQQHPQHHKQGPSPIFKTITPGPGAFIVTTALATSPALPATPPPSQARTVAAPATSPALPARTAAVFQDKNS